MVVVVLPYLGKLSPNPFVLREHSVVRVFALVAYFCAMFGLVLILLGIRRVPSQDTPVQSSGTSKFVRVAVVCLLVIGVTFSFLHNLSLVQRIFPDVPMWRWFTGATLGSALLGIAFFSRAVQRYPTALPEKIHREIYVGFGGGFLSQFIGIVSSTVVAPTGWLWMLWYVCGILAVVGAAVFHAKAKGYSRLWGLLGAMGAFGVAILILLPGRNVVAEPREKEAT